MKIIMSSFISPFNKSYFTPPDFTMQNRKNTEEYSRDIKVGKSSFEKTGPYNWSSCKSQKGMEPGVRKCKRSLLVCHTRCKCSVKSTRKLVIIKLRIGMKVIKLVKSLIGVEVTVTGRAAECQLTFARGRLHIV